MEHGSHYDGMPHKNPYDVLGVSHRASDADVKSAYRRLALQSHPDKRPETLDDSRRDELEEQWHDINDAHSFLSEADSAKEKKRFDAHLAAEEASARVCQLASERVRLEEEERSQQTARHEEGKKIIEEEGDSTESKEEERGSSHTASSDENRSTSSTKLEAGERKRTPAEASAAKMVASLASRAYHLPGGDWTRDWLQYMLNNHPLWGICCHHPLHPLTVGPRLLFLLGSAWCGVTITNALSLWFHVTGTSDEEEVFAVHVPGGASLPVSRGMALLLTAGSGSHALLDHLAWRLPRGGGGRAARLGYCVFAFLAVAVVACLSSVVVLATIPGAWPGCDRCGLAAEAAAQVSEFFESFDDQGCSFLTAYALEFALASLVYWPLVATVLFSGIFGCGGRVPIVGGRPYDMRCEAHASAEENGDGPSQHEPSEDPSHMA